jgi:hypothetical protein
MKLRDLESAFIQCRTLRHAWDEIPDDGGTSKRVFKESGGVARLMFRCERCSTLRREAWGKITGTLLFRTYEYPDDYSLEDKDERSVVEYRKMYVKRLLVAHR